MTASRASAPYLGLLTVLTAALAWFSWTRRFLMDDAFISARYAANWIAGHGLVWNPGEAVEGYTNFAWVVVMAVGLKLGLTIETLVYGLGPILCAATLLLVARLARRRLDSERAALTVVALLGTNVSFAAFATGGLETGFLAMLLTATWVVASEGEGAPSWGRAATVSALAGLCVLTRQDACLAAGVACLVVLFRLQRQGGRRSAVLALFVPGALLVGSWLAWKVSFYGDIFPNTYYAKTGAEGLLGAGLTFLATFADSYLLWPMLALTAVALIARAVQRDVAPVAAPVLAVLLTWAYIAKVGGDHMEFRFLIPTLPLVYLVFGWVFATVVRSNIVRTGLFVALIGGSLAHARGFEIQHGIAPIEHLHGYLHDPAHGWIEVGQRLGEDLEGTDVTIAVTAAGAIPYFSNLVAQDMLGLTDPWIAHNGLDNEIETEHLRIAPFSYLLARRLNLIVAHPWVRKAPRKVDAYPFRALQALYFLRDVSPSQLPPDAAMVEVPLSDDRILTALYLTRHPAVEKAATERGWRIVPLVR